jgi:hypothetical protein
LLHLNQININPHLTLLIFMLFLGFYY